MFTYTHTTYFHHPHTPCISLGIHTYIQTLHNIHRCIQRARETETETYTHFTCILFLSHLHCMHAGAVNASRGQCIANGRLTRTHAGLASLCVPKDFILCTGSHIHACTHKHVERAHAQTLENKTCRTFALALVRDVFWVGMNFDVCAGEWWLLRLVVYPWNWGCSMNVCRRAREAQGDYHLFCPTFLDDTIPDYPKRKMFIPPQGFVHDNDMNFRGGGLNWRSRLKFRS